MQAVVQLSQQISDHVVPDAMAHRSQRLGEIAQAATGPQQRRLWIAARRRLDQALQVGQQRSISRGQLLAPAAGTTHPTRERVAAGLGAKFGEAAIDGAAGNAGDP